MAAPPRHDVLPAATLPFPVIQFTLFYFIIRLTCRVLVIPLSAAIKFLLDRVSIALSFLLIIFHG